MEIASFSGALGAVLYAIFIVVCVYVYVSLVRQIAARPFSLAGDPAVRSFGVPEIGLALVLVAFFLWSVVLSMYGERRRVGFQEILAGLYFVIGLLVFLVAFLRLRGLDLNMLAGFSRLSLRRSIGIGLILLVSAYPLIYLGDTIMRLFTGTDSESNRQQLIEFFSGSETFGQRVVIIFLAVMVAPIAEEFIFRFFLYGVMRRYLGRFLGVILTSFLFAAVHTHLPTFGALFILGACFTVAYEWSGSILVPMTMHALFNSVTLTLLAFPETFPQ